MKMFARMAACLALVSFVALPSCDKAGAYEMPELKGPEAAAQKNAKGILDTVKGLIDQIKTKAGKATGDAKTTAEKQVKDLTGEYDGLMKKLSGMKDLAGLTAFIPELNKLQAKVQKALDALGG